MLNSTDRSNDCKRPLLVDKLAKFSQNPSLGDFLLSSANSVIVEASPVDAIRGVGPAADDAAIA